MSTREKEGSQKRDRGDTKRRATKEGVLCCVASAFVGMPTSLKHWNHKSTQVEIMFCDDFKMDQKSLHSRFFFSDASRFVSESIIHKTQKWGLKAESEKGKQKYSQHNIHNSKKSFLFHLDGKRWRKKLGFLFNSFRLLHIYHHLLSFILHALCWIMGNKNGYKNHDKRSIDFFSPFFSVAAPLSLRPHSRRQIPTRCACLPLPSGADD